MKSNDISQIPVVDSEMIVGSITENKLLEYIFEDPLNNINHSIKTIIEEPFPMVDIKLAITELKKFMDKHSQAVITEDNIGNKHIITQYDILQAL